MAFKICRLASSLLGDANDILQKLLDEQPQYNFDDFSSALELRFGEKCVKGLLTSGVNIIGIGYRRR